MPKVRRPGRRHPTLQLLPSLATKPAIRLSNRSAMRATWRDPEDDRPGAARTARTVTHYRAFCPLLRCLHRHGAASSITAEHVAAAHELRLLWDRVSIGFSGRRELWVFVDAVHGPRDGPGAAALASVRAWPEFQRALRLFDAEQRELLTHSVLRNGTLEMWQRERHIGRARAMTALVGILDELVEHFRSEIDRHGAIAA